MSDFIPKDKYRYILENIPICCVELICIKDNKVLLVKRKNKPAKDEWWFPGGRILKREAITDAAIRKAEEEIGVSVKVNMVIGCI